MIPYQKLPNPHNSHNESCKINDLSSDSQLSEQSSQSDTQLHPQLLQKTLKTLRKLRKISKQRKLAELKTKNKIVNSIFKSMSQLFFVKSKAHLQKKQKQKQLREARKEALKKVRIRKTQNFLKLSQRSENRQKPQQQQQVIQDFLQQYSKDPTMLQIKSLKCYICKSNYINIHHFYDCMCIDCGDFNHSKRTQSADFKGFVALVTGARIKIGFEIALKLLRDGATVIATTRFFNDALLRYQKEKDYASFSDRLYIIQCDFTSNYQVSQMISKVKQKFVKIDILINNAAQTIVRPKQFYLQELINDRKEIDYLPEHLREFTPTRQLQNIQLAHRYPSLYLPDNNKRSGQLQIQLTQTSAENQLQLLKESSKGVIDHNIRDEFDQPLDKRATNSWVEKLQDVSLIDCYTTQLVNSIVPFHLISQLKPLMKKTVSEIPSFIINVSSMQGVFNRHFKNPTHPHTNMAKAALNMITRTSGSQFAKDNIYMSSVDTGWITQQNPTTVKLQRVIPLDCIDGAMRVLDPIYLWRLTGYKHYGKFLKDYKESNW